MKTKNSTRRAFTLLELLVVIAIITVLAVIITPEFGVMSAESLNQSGLALADGISYARQTAIAQNEAIEVRFYQYANPDYPGEIAGNPSTGKYRAFQIFQIADSGVATACNSVQYLSKSIIIDSGSTLSSILSNSQLKTWNPPLDPKISLPMSGTTLIGANYNCMVFRFHADGSTTLSSAPPSPPGAWCVTLHSNSLGDGLKSPPLNFISVRLDPVSGKVMTFHP